MLGFWLDSGLQKVLSYKRATCAEGKDWEKLESVLARQRLFLNWQKLPTSHGGPVLLGQEGAGGDGTLGSSSHSSSKLHLPTYLSLSLSLLSLNSFLF